MKKLFFTLTLLCSINLQAADSKPAKSAEDESKKSSELSASKEKSASFTSIQAVAIVKKTLELTMKLAPFSLPHGMALYDFVKSVDDPEYVIEVGQPMSILKREGLIAVDNKVKEDIRQAFKECGGDEIRTMHKTYIGFGKLKNF